MNDAWVEAVARRMAAADGLDPDQITAGNARDFAEKRSQWGVYRVQSRGPNWFKYRRQARMFISALGVEKVEVFEKCPAFGVECQYVSKVYELQTEVERMGHRIKELSVKNDIKTETITALLLKIEEMVGHVGTGRND